MHILANHIEDFEKYLQKVNQQLIVFLDHASAIYEIRKAMYSREPLTFPSKDVKEQSMFSECPILICQYFFHNSSVSLSKSV